jgi:beta-lactamase regulating signal transducer with metallopeptidase domain
MEGIFRVLLNMSYTGALVLLAVLPIRFLLRKSPRYLLSALWLLPLFRLLCPVSIQSGLALLPGTEPLPREFLTAQAPEIHTGIPALNSTINPAVSGSLTAPPYASANPAQVLLWALGWVWLAGVCAFLIYALISSLRLRGRLRFATLLEPGVYESDRIPTAFVHGVLHPAVYVPAGLSGESRVHVLLHERAHIRRRDYMLQPLFFLALALHWFNPLAWLLYALFVRDMELACDESALRHAEGDLRQAYSSTLLSLSEAKGLRPALAFGQSSTKARIKSILQYKKPAFWVVAGGVVVICVAGALLLLNPPALGNSVGIIGGADGPTQVYITKKDGDGNSSATPTPMTALNGQDLKALGDVVVFYEGGLIKRIASIPADSDEARYFIDSIIFDHMIRSAAWSGLDMKDYPDRVDIYRAGSEAAQGIDFSVFHVFLKDGKPCHQMGDGMYSIMSQELYDQLLLFGTPEFPDIVLPSPNPYAPTPIPSPVATSEIPGEGAVTPAPTPVDWSAAGILTPAPTLVPSSASEVQTAPAAEAAAESTPVPTPAQKNK